MLGIIQKMKKIFFVSILLTSFSSVLLSQSIFEKGNSVIDLPNNNWVVGTKKISVFLIRNSSDSILQSEEIYSMEGNRLQFVKYSYDSGKLSYTANFSYENGKLIEEKKKTSGKKYSYNGENIKKIESWSSQKDTSISIYHYNNQDIIKQTIKTKAKESNLQYSYNERHQLLSKSISDEIYKNYEYDTLGNLIKEMDSDLNEIERKHKYDELNNLIETTTFNGTEKYVDCIRRYKYNEKNKLIEWTYINGKRKVFKIEQYIYTESGKRTLIFYKRLKKHPDEIYIEKYEYW